MERLGEHGRTAGIREDVPMREQLSELPGGTYLVARFDHIAALGEVLDTIMAEPVGFLGGSEGKPGGTS
jgi:hypothetical protein